MIGRLERVPLREVWKNEAKDFTRWLQENIDSLNDILDVTLANLEREKSAGAFSIDLVAEDERGNTAIIENQLERSDHDHLGKVITYLTAYDAKTAVWVVSRPRPEHVKAVSWLNEASSADFYLIKVEAVRIENSPPAPLFTVIVGPSIEAKRVGEAKKELSGRHGVRRRFWEDLLARANAKTPLHSGVSAGTETWIGTSAGKTGFYLQYVTRRHDVRVELYIDLGKDSGERSKELFDAFLANKEKIESVFGESLEWERLEGKRACRIRKDLDMGGYADEEKWPQIHETMIDSMIRLDRALRPFINKS